MVESLIGVVALVALVVALVRQQSRLGLLERELGALRSLVLSLPVAGQGTAAPAPADASTGESAAPRGFGDMAVLPMADGLARDIDATKEAAEAAQLGNRTDQGVGAAAEAAFRDRAAAQPAEAAAISAGAAGQPGPATRQRIRAGEAAEGERRPVRADRDIETALGTRWAVWVGGVALALGGVFLVRYSIEAGLFGPAMRLFMAALFGAVLLAGGEVVRRMGFRMPAAGAANAYIPAILTAAGALTLFATVYAAHATYGFVGPAVTFVLLGAIGVGTVALALVHGQALAGIGLLGALATPLLVASEAPSPWSLFGYLAVVLAATAAIARSRYWAALMAAAFVGTGLWSAVYLMAPSNPRPAVILFINAVALAVLALVWLARRFDPLPETKAAVDWVSTAPAVFVALSAWALFVDPEFAGAGAAPATVLIAAMLAVAIFRLRALPLLHAAGAVVVLIHLRVFLVGSARLEFSGGTLEFDGLPGTLAVDLSLPVGLSLAAITVAAGLWNAWGFAGSSPQRAVRWAAWGASVPAVVAGALWLTFGDPNSDWAYALPTFALAAALGLAADWIARAEQPPMAGQGAVSALLIGAGAALLLALHMAFGPGLTTILVGAAAALPAAATRVRRYRVLGWLSVGAVVATMARIAVDPTIVGAEELSTTPVFNWLLPGYGVPALAFAYAAWQLKRRQDGRPRLAMEAAAVLFALLTVAMLVRHAMSGGVIDAGAPTLAEQAIYTLLALGAGAILIALDLRSPSPVLRYGSIAFGVLSAAMAALQHLLLLNPALTDESTGRIPFFDLPFLAYLLPAAAAAGLAWYAQHRRPRWYSAMLAGLAAVLGFAYATLSLRRLFHGEFIALWRGLGQVETYAYSALWLALGALLLAVGVRFRSQVLRIASAALISVSVAKVFLFDMSELEGVLRALSFIGLGAVLIGIGLFYQRLLTREAAR